MCKENKNDLWIKKFKYWNLHVCWFQHTLGTLGIILKRHAEKFSELTHEEIEELGEIVKLSQKILDETFKPDWYNIQQNCNLHRHFHFVVLPRYKKSRKFKGKIYEDKTFGEPIVYIKKKEAESVRKELTELLVKHI
jgi:diadenosine tetraphosphate (Ap4A) HIT family hydrolase